MIPQIDELLELRHRAHTIGLGVRHRVTSSLAGLYGSVFRGRGMDFEENREYREGDEFRYIDWRVTARKGSPHLKVFREERERPVMLCVDVGAHMRFGTRGTFKSVQAARAAALLGWAATANKDRVGALLFGDAERRLEFFCANRSRSAFWRMLQGLARARHGGHGRPREDLMEALLRADRVAPTGGLMFVIGHLDLDANALRPALGRLRQRHEVVLVPVDDPADRELPDMGRVVFLDADGREVEVDTTDEDGRRRYLAAWEARRLALREVCKRLGIGLLPVATDGDVETALVDGLKYARRPRGQR